MPARFRSVLYLPADNARAVEKARGLDCDLAVLDLEDAVAPDRKVQARADAVAALASHPFGVRINGLDTPWGRTTWRPWREPASGSWSRPRSRAGRRSSPWLNACPNAPACGP